MTHVLRSGSALLGALIVTVATAVTADPRPPINVSRGELALRGYDAVAYFTTGQPVRGLPGLEHRWNGAVWRFASQANRDAFVEDPQRYAPQFGGYCAYAVSRGYTADGDPNVWRLVEGRLYLNYSPRAQRLWERDIPGNIQKGRANWPGALAR